jgi:hypothetical protein
MAFFAISRHVMRGGVVKVAATRPRSLGKLTI